jgi:hypothetical protein
MSGLEWSSPSQRSESIGFEPIIGEARERQRRRRRRTSLLVLGAILVALVSYGHLPPWRGGASVSATHSSSPQAAQLPQESGWNGGSTRIYNKSCPRCVQFDSWAATVPYRDAANDFPQKTMAILGPQDLIVLVSRAWQPAEPAWALERHPLRIAPSQVHANFEGNTTHGRVSVWLGTTWRRGSSVSVYVYFGSSQPSAQAIARAQHELDRTTFAPWSPGR